MNDVCGSRVHPPIRLGCGAAVEFLHFSFFGFKCTSMQFAQVGARYFSGAASTDESTATTWHLLSRPHPVSHVLYVLCPLSDTCRQRFAF